MPGSISMIQQVEYDLDDIEKFLEIHEQSKEYQNSETLKKLISVQNKISILKNIEAEDLKFILDDLKIIIYNYKDTIIKEGEVSNKIFFILSGEYQVFVENKKVGALKSNDTFGESAAIFNTKRNAMVICSSKESTVLSFSINEESFDFCAEALATLYKNLAYQINNKLEHMNSTATKK
jgi:CRP-like cAMP-binding protein